MQGKDRRHSCSIVSWSPFYATKLIGLAVCRAAKRMPYGGAVRTRISSQCLKRHWRTAADEWSFEEEADKSLRTRHIFEKQLHQAVKRHTNAPDEIVEAVGKAVTVMLYGREPVKERQAMLFGRPEIQAIERLSISLVQDAVAAGA